MPSAMRPKYGCEAPSLGSFGRRSSVSRSEAVVEMEREERGVVREERWERTGDVEVLALREGGRDVVGVVGVEADWPRRPKMPGSRWPKGRMALNMCVTIVAPAAMAAEAVSKLASEWPIEKTMPREVNSGIRLIMLPRSGAAVTLRMLERFDAP